MGQTEFTGVSVKPETREKLRMLKSIKEYKSYDQLISEEIGLR